MCACVYTYLYVYNFFRKLSILSLPSPCLLLPLAVMWILCCLWWAADLPAGFAASIATGTTQGFEHPTSWMRPWMHHWSRPNPWYMWKVPVQPAQGWCIFWEAVTMLEMAGPGALRASSPLPQGVCASRKIPAWLLLLARGEQPGASEGDREQDTIWGWLRAPRLGVPALQGFLHLGSKGPTVLLNDFHGVPSWSQASVPGIDLGVGGVSPQEHALPCPVPLSLWTKWCSRGAVTASTCRSVYLVT